MDKIDRLLEAIEHPERYSESELEAMLHDPEMSDVLDLLDKTKSSIQPTPTPDVDAEWKSFERANRNRLSKARFMRFSRKSAAGIAIAIASFAAVAAAVGAGVSYFSHKNAENSVSEPTETENATVSRTDTLTVAEETNATLPETIIFDNETLENIVSGIAAYYGYQSAFNAETPKSLRLHFRWDQVSPIEEIIESLNNFEQIHISISGKTIIID